MHYPEAIALAANLRGAETDPAEFYAVDEADVTEAESRQVAPGWSEAGLAPACI